jgi:hypothetical protein
MITQQFQLFKTRESHDTEVLNRDIYITKWFEDSTRRLLLLENGELALGNYVDYHRFGKPEGAIKLVGRGFPHYFLVYQRAFENIYELKNYQIAQHAFLKEDLLDMSYVLVNRNQVTGEYTFYQGDDIEKLFS